MPIRWGIVQKIPSFFSLFILAILVGLAVSMTDYIFSVYFVIILASFTLAAGISALFNHPKIIIQITLFALSIRIFLFVLLKIYSYQNGLDGFFPGDVDAYSYHGDAVEALRSHSWMAALEGNLPYTYFVTFLYSVFGIDMNIPQLFNLGASVLLTPLIYELGYRVRGPKFGTLGVLLWSIFPSSIFWSISLLKDSFVTLGMVLSTFIILAVSKEKMNGYDLMLGGCGIVLVLYTRPQFLLAIAIPIIAVIVYQLFKGKSSFLRNLVFLAIGLFLLGMSSAGDIIWERLADSTTVEGVEQANQIALSGGSAIEFVTYFPPEIKWLVQLPFSILAPFPWQWFSVSQGIYIFSAVEMLVWYLIYYHMWKNRASIFQNIAGRLIFLYACSIFIAVSFSLPNIGSIYRYRLAALALLLSLFFYQKKKKKKEG